MLVSRKQLVILISSLYLVFVFATVGKVPLLRNLTGTLFIFFIPGFVFSLVYLKKINFVERLCFSVAISLVLNVALALFLNLVLKVGLGNFFAVALFFILTALPLAKLYQERKEFDLEFKLDNLSKLLLLFVIISIILRVVLFLKIGTILGADVGRFGIIAKTFLLKGNITPNLQPYDLASGFFYFPGAFVLPMLFELIGINSIVGVTLAVFILSFLSGLAFYLMGKIFFDRKVAVSMFFFYSIVFDISLNLGLFGVFPFGLGVFFFILLSVSLLKFYFKKSENILLLFFPVAGVLFFHGYLALPSLIFFFSLISYELLRKGNLKKCKSLFFQLIKAALLVLLILAPYFLYFGGGITVPFQKDNTADLMTFASERRGLTIKDKISTLLFFSHGGTNVFSLALVGLFLFIVFIWKKLKGSWLNKKVILILLLLYLLVFNLNALKGCNLHRNSEFNWMFYSAGFSLALSEPPLNLATIPIFYYVESPSLPYYIRILEPRTEMRVNQWVIWPGYEDMIKFIRKNVPKNATFLIDGGGAGCTGASSSYGERIFSLTSRKIFYFTDYCWAEYNRSEYEKRVDLYRKISINPDSEALKELKNYSVTHVYIGPNSVGLKEKLFEKSKNYRKIYDENDFAIFKIK